MPRRYERPPLVEALCEFRFRPKPDVAWDGTIPFRLYDTIKDPYRQVNQVMQLNLELQSVQAAAPPEQRTLSQFKTDDGKAAVQIAKNLLAINYLDERYPGWDEFRRVIMEQLDHYIELADPDSFEAINLRYVDRITIAASQFNLSDYFVMFPLVPHPESHEIARFRMLVDLSYQPPVSSIRVSFGSDPEVNPEHAKFILQIDAIGAVGDVPTFAEVEAWLTSAHDRIESIFETSFTEKTHKDVFGEVQS